MRTSGRDPSEGLYRALEIVYRATMPGWSRIVCAAAGAWLLVATDLGCAAGTALDGGRATLSITAHAGGTHYCTRMVGGLWYQTFGQTLLVIDPATADVLTSLELAPIGVSGPATDLLAVGDRLFVVLQGSEVIDLSTADPRRPRILGRTGAVELGVEPMALSLVGGELYVSGRGGVVRWSDRMLWLEGMDCRTVVECDLGLVACVGRRVYRLDDADYVGSAGELFAVPDATGLAAPLVFVRQGAGRTSVGLMSGVIRELDVRLATVSVPGVVRRVRVDDGRLWVIADQRIAAYPISGDRLLDPVMYEIAGAWDMDFIDAGPDRRVVVAGAFGRAIVRLGPGPGVTVEHEHREPAGLIGAQSDGRFVLAGGPYGSWLYEPGGMASPSPLAPDAAMGQRLSAVTMSGTAARTADGKAVTLSGGGVYREPGSPMIRCLVAVEGNLWVGHDHGITVMTVDGEVLGRLRLDGPILNIFAVSGGGAVWVSERGGFGTARLVR